MAVILEVHRSAVEIERAKELSAGGFRFMIEVDVNADENVDHQQVMKKAIDSGVLAELFRKYWKLQIVPVFSALDCKVMSAASETEMTDIFQAGAVSKTNSAVEHQQVKAN